MEENIQIEIIENKPEGISPEQNPGSTSKNNQSQIAGAIIIAGLIIAGAILLKGNDTPTAPDQFSNITLAKINTNDKILGNTKAKVAVIMYEDFQCPFCGAVFGSQSNVGLMQALKQHDASWTAFEPILISDYVNTGKLEFVYRDYAFLGPESVQAGEAARCAGDQGQFWQYHDYLFNHQNGENKGGFSDTNLKMFAKNLNLDTTSFNTCLDSGKYAQAMTDAKKEGDAAGVTGTPKGYILRNGKIVNTIDGAEPWSTIKPKIDAALK